MDNTRVRTYPVKNLTIFASVAFVVSVAAIIAFAFFNNELWVIRILVWIFCSIFAVAAGIILAWQLTCYVEVTDEFFIKHFLLTKTRIPYKKIERIKNKDGWYLVYVGGKSVTSFTTDTKEAQQIIIFLEKKGIKIDW